MTNAQIIFMESQRLAEEGIITYTGRTFTAVNSAGQEIEVKETEEIHTFKIWQDLGYQVQKGQKAVTKIQIWKHTGAKMEEVKTEDGSVSYIDKGHMFMKTAAFFSRSQVEKIA